MKKLEEMHRVYFKFSGELLEQKFLVFSMEVSRVFCLLFSSSCTKKRLDFGVHLNKDSEYELSVSRFFYG